MWKSEVCMRKTPCEGEINLLFYLFLFNKKPVDISITAVSVLGKRLNNSKLFSNDCVTFPILIFYKIMHLRGTWCYSLI